MEPTTLSARDEQSTPHNRHVRVDVAVGLGLLAIAIIGKLVAQVTDLGFLTALSLR